MSSSEYSKIQLKIEREIRRSEDDLVKWIENALDETSYGKVGKDKLEESQFRNLIRVAETTESTEVVINFIRYQMGRDQKWGRGKGSLGEKIIHDIQLELKQKAEGIAEAVISREEKEERNRIEEQRKKQKSSVKIDLDEAIRQYVDQIKAYIDIKEVWILLIRLYLGYGSRHLKYLLMLRDAQAKQQETSSKDKPDKPDQVSSPSKKR